MDRLVSGRELAGGDRVGDRQQFGIMTEQVEHLVIEPGPVSTWTQ